uniref:Secreted protein n=1 Tax=Arundo donax TaxID=35708 RepID=A0A0A9H2G0_ARUDO
MSHLCFFSFWVMLHLICCSVVPLPSSFSVSVSSVPYFHQDLLSFDWVSRLEHCSIFSNSVLRQCSAFFLLAS